MMLSRFKKRKESSTVYSEVANQSLSTEICRICLKEGEIPIFGPDDKSEDVVVFGGIEIAADDNLPQHLCYSCNSLLESAIVFRTTAKKSDVILTNTEYLEDISISSEDQNYVLDTVNETDNEPFIKREYLEYRHSSESESELTIKYEPESDNKLLTNIKSDPDTSISVPSEVANQSLSTEICRICLKEGEIPIFGPDDKSEDVVVFGGIEIAADDNLPQHLCYSCNSLLESAIVFRTTAKKSDEILKNTEYLEDISISSEDQNYVLDTVNEMDNEPFIKREYLEYRHSSESESELTIKYEPESDNELLTNIKSDPDTSISVTKKNIQMQLLNLKDGAENIDVDNELVMIIVSDKEKPDKSSLTCLKCNLTFKNPIELEQHKSTNHPETPIWYKKCDICHESVHKNKFEQHIKQHRQTYKEKHDKKYGKVECEVCSKKINKTYYKYHLKMHGSAEEQADRYVECTLCNKTFSAHYYSDHLKRVHNKTFRPKQTSQNADEEESKIQVIIKCPICDKNVNENIYKEHLAKHGGPTRRYICDKCGREFKHPSAFKTHTLTHGSELKYQCQFCPYRGLHLGLLKVHVRTHTGDYNYKCSECPAQFITKSNLTKHLIRHRGLWKFKCSTCNKGFYSKRDVDKHIRTVHLDLKNNVCDKCGKGFGHRDNLLSHQLKVHKREKLTDRRGRMPSYLKEEYKKS